MNPCPAIPGSSIPLLAATSRGWPAARLQQSRHGTEQLARCARGALDTSLIATMNPKPQSAGTHETILYTRPLDFAAKNVDLLWQKRVYPDPKGESS